MGSTQLPSQKSPSPVLELLHCPCFKHRVSQVFNPKKQHKVKAIEFLSVSEPTCNYEIFPASLNQGSMARSLDCIYTVDGRNPAPVNMVNIPLFTGFHTCWVVVWDFFHQQYHKFVPIIIADSYRKCLELKLFHSAGEAVLEEEILDFSSLICIKSHWKHTRILEEILGWF